MNAPTNALPWDPTMPELLPREADWLHAHPHTRAELVARESRVQIALRRIAKILFAPIVFVWVLSMGVFLIPVFVPLAVLFWLPIGAHYRDRKSPDPRRLADPETHAAQGM